MDGKVMPFSIDFSSILTATILAFLALFFWYYLTVDMLGGEDLVICIIVSVRKDTQSSRARLLSHHEVF